MRFRIARISGSGAAAALLAAAIGILAATPGGGDPLAMVPVSSSTTLTNNPFTGAKLYVDPASPAARAAAALRTGDPAGARLLDKVAAHPQADWIGDWTPTTQLAAQVDARVRTVQAAGAVPVFVAYAIPQRDCGLYSAGGIGTPAGYQAWVRQLAAGIGARKAVVILEPDALAAMDCLSTADRSTRLALLRDAVSVLAARGGTAVYLDAGHAGWQSAATMSSRLAAAGVTNARGFSLNVSNFGRTADQVAYGRAISPAIGWKRFVVDTSRNGLGAATGPLAWCNPSGRALGERPGTPVDDRLVDSLLWVKRPGESDGSCGRGEPAAGVWWTDYARGLAARAAW